MSEDNDRRARAAAAEILLHPGELLRTQVAGAAVLRLQHVDECHEMHACVVEAVVALVARGLAEAVEVFAHRGVGHIVFARYRVQFARFQPTQQLLRHIELFGLGQVRDVSRVQGERGPVPHPVDQVDGGGERAVHIRIGILVKADVCVADLDEQGFAQRPLVLATTRGCGQVDRRENAATQGEQGAGAAEGHALQGAAT